MIIVYYYHRPTDQDKTSILDKLTRLQTTYPHRVIEVDVTQDAFLDQQYPQTPVVDVGQYRVRTPIAEQDLEFAFKQLTAQLETAKTRNNQVYIERMTSLPKMTKSDQFTLWFSKHYMALCNFFLILYLGLACLAPVLMKVGAEAPARVIYKGYRIMCHQLAFRSFFLFGEQLVYPREIAGIDGLMTYGEVSGLDEMNTTAASNFAGNERMGYKIALCQRDVAMYLLILLFALAFVFTKHKIKPLPWWLWVVLGVLPIGLDGFSQLLSQTGITWLAWIGLRESTPFLRVLTGGMFGLFSAWVAFPYMEEVVKENRDHLIQKIAVIKQIKDVRN